MKCIALIALLFIIGCGGLPDHPADKKLVVIGFDSADWQAIDPLISAGEMPNFKSFLDSGNSGTLMSFVPMDKSPRIWASIATGLHPRDHGIGGFLKKNKELSCSSDWSAPALWDIVGGSGRSSCVVGWWVTWPAQPIDGVMVSDHMSFTRKGSREGTIVQPDSIDLSDSIVDWESISNEELSRFIDLDALSGHEEEYALKLDELRIIYASDLTYLATLKQLVADQQFDLSVVYFRGLDVASHKFWTYWKTESAPRKYNDLDIAVLGNIIPGYYKFVDELLGEVLALFPEDQQVAIMSDHGFNGPRHRKRGWQYGVQEHRPEGIFATRSPLYKPGHKFEQMEMLDTAPTLLALLGLPASEAMTGTILAVGLTNDGQKYVEYLSENKVSSYASFLPARVDTVIEQTEVDDEIKKQLKSLGYIN
jgi:predicted AlkP superfamily phosphohydrolase/phosphomutase